MIWFKHFFNSNENNFNFKPGRFLFPPPYHPHDSIVYIRIYGNFLHHWLLGHCTPLTLLFCCLFLLSLIYCLLSKSSDPFRRVQVRITVPFGTQQFSQVKNLIGHCLGNLAQTIHSSKTPLYFSETPSLYRSGLDCTSERNACEIWKE